MIVMSHSCEKFSLCPLDGSIHRNLRLSVPMGNFKGTKKKRDLKKLVDLLKNSDIYQGNICIIRGPTVSLRVTPHSFLQVIYHAQLLLLVPQVYQLCLLPTAIPEHNSSGVIRQAR